MATSSKINLLDSTSPVMEQMSFFHDHTMMILTLILTMVGYVMFSLTSAKQTNKSTMENQTLETLWTLAPAVILMFIALPSLKILYLTDEMNKPSLTLKAIGHQWYWSYEYPDFNNKEFDTYMTQWENNDNFRLLDVDNRTVLPMNTLTRILVTATDVIHSWTIPAMGVKMDATPGRINQMSMISKTPGLFFGQCSEICGSNHSFMPIAVELTSTKNFTKWMKNI
uniref:Cytochrome c oxidase subunit 2 n=1 Tax=Symphylella sp. YG-2006 TaxID=390856 RepID=B7S764_9MYRI|nr:cytochrome c oxidase subunit II [Symphylella sp. YG-2006]ABQ01733.1 cytochrome c oxidase subunit II [Symphylella sp. YG-2006]